MATRNAFLILLSALLIALAGPGVVAPGNAGGGEEGTEILPGDGGDGNDDGDDGDGSRSGGGDGLGSVPPGIPIAFYSDSPVQFRDGDLRTAALVVSRDEGNYPQISFEAFVKAPHQVALDREVELGVESFSTAGRLEIMDFDPRDGEALTLQAAAEGPGAVLVVIGRRFTHSGPILQSFDRIDRTFGVVTARARIALQPLREQVLDVLGGQGQDVAVVVMDQASGEYSVAAFYSDDLTPVYDVETPLD